MPASYAHQSPRHACYKYNHGKLLRQRLHASPVLEHAYYEGGRIAGQAGYAYQQACRLVILNSHAVD